MIKTMSFKSVEDIDLKKKDRGEEFEAKNNGEIQTAGSIKCLRQNTQKENDNICKRDDEGIYSRNVLGDLNNLMVPKQETKTLSLVSTSQSLKVKQNCDDKNKRAFCLRPQSDDQESYLYSPQHALEQGCDYDTPPVAESEKETSIKNPILGKASSDGIRANKEKNSEGFQLGLNSGQRLANPQHQDSHLPLGLGVTLKRADNKNVYQQREQHHIQRRGPDTVTRVNRSVAELMKDQHLYATGELKHALWGRRMMCPYCPEERLTLADLHMHMNVVHNVQFFKHPCHICIKGFKSISQLKCHMIFHANPELKCVYCHKQYYCKTSFQVHVGRSHLFHEAQAPLKFKCDLCPEKSFKRKIGIANHMKIHFGEKKSCSLCNMSFAQESSLARHNERFHKENSRYVCETCGDRFGTSNGLQRHLSVHTLKRNKCSYCGHVLKTKVSLENHMIVYHTANLMANFKCTKCEQSFIHSVDFENHKSQHEDGKNGISLPTTAN